VGSWPRAKLTATECFEYEIKCLLLDFNAYKQELINLLESEECGKIFPIRRRSQAKSKTSISNANTSLMFRLTSVDCKQYKLSLKHLVSDDLLTDAQGRDFTCNALYCNVGTKVFCDPLDGIEDTLKGVLRTVGPPQHIFSTDANLFFRLFEFSVKYGFSMHSDIIKYLKTRRGFNEVLNQSTPSQIKTLCSAVRKFFYKSYVPDMIRLIVELNFVDFFRLNFADKELFRRVFSCLPDVFELVAASLNGPFGRLLLEKQSTQNSKAFLMKARLFTVSFFSYVFQPSYGFEFLKMFLHDNKKLPTEYAFLMAELHRVADQRLRCFKSTDISPFSDSEEAEVCEVITKYECDKSCWVFLLVYAGYKLYNLRDFHGRGIERASGQS